MRSFKGRSQRADDSESQASGQERLAFNGLAIDSDIVKSMREQQCRKRLNMNQKLDKEKEIEKEKD